MRGAEDAVSRSFKVKCGRTEEENAAAQPLRKWPAARVREWLATLEPKLAIVAARLPATVDGRELLQRWPAMRLAHSCLEGDGVAARQLYDAIRDECAAECDLVV